MTTVTLETIKAEQAAEREQVHFPETLIDLNPGEHYAGLIVGKDGAPSYHLILLPGEAENVTFVGAEKWAASIGGELPPASSRRCSGRTAASTSSSIGTGPARSPPPSPAGPGVSASAPASRATAPRATISAPGPSAD